MAAAHINEFSMDGSKVATATGLAWESHDNGMSIETRTMTHIVEIRTAFNNTKHLIFDTVENGITIDSPCYRIEYEIDNGFADSVAEILKQNNVIRKD